LIDISILKEGAAESTKASNAIVDNLNNAEQTIARQQSTIEEQSNSYSFLNNQLELANAAVTNLKGVNQGLESDVAYLVDQQKYTNVVANRLKEANGTILRLQSIIQELKAHSSLGQGCCLLSCFHSICHIFQ
jgi:predicted nuclease with TOPRIM domain